MKRLEDIIYQDYLTVLRIAREENGKSKKDEDGDVIYDKIYEGECDYQMKPNETKTTGEMLITDPQVFFPLSEVILQQDDIVKVRTHYGRKIEGHIRDFDKIDIKRLRQCVIYLKLGKNE